MQSRRETLLCQYRYDALDRLITNELSNAAQHRRFYCKSRLATEIQGVMRYSIVQHGDQLLAQQQSETGAPDTTLLATDQQRSVLQALKTGHPRQPVAYSPYGHHPTANGLLSLLAFNGEQPDPVTGCYLLGNGYRAFNPVLMRFNSPDSWSPFWMGWLNSYTYCLGEPVNQRDPTGHMINTLEALDNLFVPHKIPRPSLIKQSFTKSASIQNAASPVDGYYLAGFHGSSSKHRASLEKGVNQQFAKNQAYGKGFYASPDINVAANFARYAAPSPLTPTYPQRFPYAGFSASPMVNNTSYALFSHSATIYGVYVKNYNLKIPGKDFTFVSDLRTRKRSSAPYANSALVFPAKMHKDIMVKPLESLIDPPTPWTANLDIRDS